MTRRLVTLFAVVLVALCVPLAGQQESIDELRAKAEQGDSISQFELGLAYETGRGVPEDGIEAARWYRLAAEQGVARAQANLGFMYANGEGVPEDDVLAYMWWNLAAAQGYENAQSNKDTIEEQMTREQIAEAQRLSREWLEAHPPGGT